MAEPGRQRRVVTKIKQSHAGTVRKVFRRKFSAMYAENTGL
jgi:hypothetical protein